MMTRARGQPSRRLLEREYPHQVLVLAETLRGNTLNGAFAFHTNLGIPTRISSIRKRPQIIAGCYNSVLQQGYLPRRGHTLCRLRITAQAVRGRRYRHLPGTLALSAINMQGKAYTYAARAAGFPAGPWE